MFKLLREIAQLVIGLVEMLLVVRFCLKLLGANSSASFVAWVYTASQPLLQPFLLAFPTPSVSGGMVVEFTTLFAIFAYAFLNYLIQEALVIADSHHSDHRVSVKD